MSSLWHFGFVATGAPNARDAVSSSDVLPQLHPQPRQSTAVGMAAPCQLPPFAARGPLLPGWVFTCIQIPQRCFPFFFLIQVHKYSCFPAPKNPPFLAGLPRELVEYQHLLFLPMALRSLQAARASSTPIHPTQHALQKMMKVIDHRHSNQLTYCLEKSTQDELGIQYPTFSWLG